MYYTLYGSPFGDMTLVSDGEYLTALWIEEYKCKEDVVSQNSTRKDSLKLFIETKKWLDSYFSKKNPSLKNLKLLPSGSSFQIEVWKLLLEIELGDVVTYGDVTKKIEKILNKRMSAQAVGGAIGSNPIPIIIPCHRVVGKNGSLTGYGGGIELKIKLLQLEGIDTNKYSLPKDKTVKQKKTEGQLK